MLILEHQVPSVHEASRAWCYDKESLSQHSITSGWHGKSQSPRVTIHFYKKIGDLVRIKLAFNNYLREVYEFERLCLLNANT